MKIEKMGIFNFILIILLKIMLEYLYVDVVYKFYEYSGFTYKFDIATYIIGWIVYIFGYFVVISKKNQFMFDVYLFLFLLYYLPNIIIYSFIFHDLVSLSILNIPYLVIILFSFENNYKVKYLRKGKPFVLFFSILSVIVVLANLATSTGGRMILNFSDVYIYRQEFSDLSFGGVFGYLNSWVFKFFITIIFAWSLQKKKYLYILLSIISFLLLFAFSGHKSVFIGLILVLLFYFLYKNKSKIRSTIILLGFLSLFFINIIFHWYSDEIFLQSLLIRRLLLLPSYLNYIYIDFFSTNEHLWWSNSFLKSFISNPYHKDLPFIIGNHLGHPDMDANTGFLASGFAQGGVFAVALYTILAIIIFNTISLFANKIDKYLSMSIIIVPIYSLVTSSDFPVTLLTHGLLIAVIILYLYENRTYVLEFRSHKYEI